MYKDYNPPAEPPPQGCEHKWVLMETVKQQGYSGYGSQQWKRIDRFYCEKCLEIKELVKTAPGYYDKPDWFD
jgi:hypothetical protein